MRTNVELTRLNRCQAKYYNAKNKAIFAVSQKGNITYNDRKLIVDFTDRENPKFGWSTRDICESIAMTLDANNIYRPMIGDNAGFLWLLDDASRTKDGVGYMGKGATREIPIFPEGNRRGNLKYLEVVLRASNNVTLTVQVEFDGGRTTKTLTFQVTVTGAILGSTFRVGSSSIGGSENLIYNKRRALTGDARRIKLTFYNNTNVEDFSILSFILGILPGNDKK